MNSEPESDQMAIMRALLAQSKLRTEMSAQRSEMSMQRSYMNAERTLSVWVRTALAMMIFGIAIDRFDLLIYKLPVASANAHALLDLLSRWCGAALVAVGVLLAVVTGARFMAYAAQYRRQHQPPAFHGPWLAPAMAAMAAVFGFALLVLMCMFAG